MKKGKAITLLSIISFLMAILLFITVVPFRLGIKDFNSTLGAIELDYDIEGGRSYTLKLSEDNVKPVKDVNEVLEKLYSRMQVLGYSVFDIQAVKDSDLAVNDYDIVIKANADVNKNGKPDYSVLDSDISVVSSYGKVEFFGDTSSNPSGDDKQILKDDKVISDAKYLGVANNNGEAVYQSLITFTDYGYDGLMELLNSNSTYYLRITLNGQDLYNNTISSNYFNGKSLYLTSGSETFARQSALQMKDGGLDYKYEIDSSLTTDITSPFGQNVKTLLLIIVLAIFVLTLCALILIFKKTGIVSSLSLLLFMLLELNALIAIPGIRLSIGGVFGIVASFILATDCIVVLLKRIFEEAKNGKTAKASINFAYSRSLKPIINNCVISGAVSLVLFLLTSGTIRSFAITLGIGSVLAGITALLLFRLFNALIFPLVKDKNSYVLNDVVTKEVE